MSRLPHNVYISTHSLSRRLTNLLMNIHTSLLHFNSQPLKEADDRAKNTFQGSRYFNSQPLKEADRCQHYERRDGRYFNSQPLKEADKAKTEAVAAVEISTHSLSRRLTCTV